MLREDPLRAPPLPSPPLPSGVAFLGVQEHQSGLCLRLHVMPFECVCLDFLFLLRTSVADTGSEQR